MPKSFSRLETEALSLTVRGLLESRGMSGRQLSRKLNSAHSTVSLIAVGQRQLTFLEFMKVCDVLSLKECDFIALYRENLAALELDEQH